MNTPTGITFAPPRAGMSRTGLIASGKAYRFLRYVLVHRARPLARSVSVRGRKKALSAQHQQAMQSRLCRLGTVSTMHSAKVYQPTSLWADEYDAFKLTDEEFATIKAGSPPDDAPVGRQNGKR